MSRSITPPLAVLHSKGNTIHLSTLSEDGVGGRKYLINFGRFQSKQSAGGIQVLTAVNYIVIVCGSSFMVLPKDSSSPKPYRCGLSNDPFTTQCSQKRSYLLFYQWVQINEEGRVLPVGQSCSSTNLNPSLRSGAIFFVSPLKQAGQRESDIELHHLMHHFVIVRDEKHFLVLPTGNNTARSAFKFGTYSEFGHEKHKEAAVYGKWLRCPEGSKWFTCQKKLVCLFGI
jgi:hypothetical protein